MNGCYNGLITREETTVAAHKSAFRTLITTFADIPSEGLWVFDMSGWLNGASASIDIVGIDHYPSTYTRGLCRDWTALDLLIAIIASDGKEGATMETGCAATIFTWNQAAYAACTLPVIHDKRK